MSYLSSITPSRVDVLRWRRRKPTFPLTTSRGTITGIARSAGLLTFTLRDTGQSDGRYNLSAEQEAALLAGRPIFLTRPAVTRNDDGSYTAGTALVACIDDDPPAITVEWLIDDLPAATGVRFAVPPTRRHSTVTARFTAENRKSALPGDKAVQNIRVQTEPSFSAKPMYFRAHPTSTLDQDNDHATFTPSFAGDGSAMTYMVSFVHGPDLILRNLAAPVLQFSPTQNWGVAFTNEMTIRSSFVLSDGTLAYTDTPAIALGARVDVLFSVGFVRGGLRRGRVMSRVNLGNWIIWERTVNGKMPLSAMTRLRIGGTGYSSRKSVVISRAAVWNSAAADSSDPAVLNAFFKADGRLAHPLLSSALLGEPMVDFYDGTNHGTLGTPTSWTGDYT